MKKDNYIFTSDRLGFRNWTMNDLPKFADLNADDEVMEHFPKSLTLIDTEEFIVRLQNHYDTHGFNYFAVDILNSGEFIGFIGLNHQDYEAEFNPSVDIGWRLKKSSWGYGYATEGAKRCLKFAKDDLKLDRVVSVCTSENLKSEHVMKKIGMTKKGEFKHPKLVDFPHMQECIWYEISFK